ncbi:MAG TPA: lipoprotein [Luteimonas sp.]|nr:lipoprotein [Luteimonas sp.]
MNKPRFALLALAAALALSACGNKGPLVLPEKPADEAPAGETAPATPAADTVPADITPPAADTTPPADDGGQAPAEPAPPQDDGAGA